MPIALIAVLVVIIGGVGFYFSRTPEVIPTPTDTAQVELPEAPATETPAATEPVETVTTAPATTETTPSATDTGVYKDGSFSANAAYTDPGRKEHDIAVTLTIADDVVTSASVLYNGGAASTPNHTRFENGYKQEVVGKSLESISLSRVGGASLTTEAFNDAVAAIKTEAKS